MLITKMYSVKVYNYNQVPIGHRETGALTICIIVDVPFTNQPQPPDTNSTTVSIAAMGYYLTGTAISGTSLATVFGLYLLFTGE